jgi:hypothetical protein
MRHAPQQPTVSLRCRARVWPANLRGSGKPRNFTLVGGRQSVLRMGADLSTVVAFLRPPLRKPSIDDSSPARPAAGAAPPSLTVGAGGGGGPPKCEKM